MSPNDLRTSEVLAIIGKVEAFVNQSEIIPAAAFYRSKIVLALLSKALTTGRAVCALVETGFPDEAYGLLRTLIEIFLTVRFVSNADTEERTARFAEYFGKAHEHLGDLIRKFLSCEGPNPPEQLKDAIGWSRNYPSPHQWFEGRGAVAAMAFEKDTFEFDDAGLPLKQEFDYQFVYWDSSHFVHATVMSLAAHLCPQGEPFRVRGGPIRSSRRTGYTLFNVVTFLRKTLVAACRAIRDDLPSDLLEEMLQLMRSYNAEPK